MKIIKTISTTILSVLLISSIGILSSIAIDENTKSISDILRACSPQYVDKDIIVNGVKYNIFFDARDEYCIEMPTAAVKDILSTNATVKIKADIKCDEYPFLFALTH